MASVQTFGAAKPYDIEPAAGPNELAALQNVQAKNQLLNLTVDQERGEMETQNAMMGLFRNNPNAIDQQTGMIRCPRSRRIL